MAEREKKKTRVNKRKGAWGEAEKRGKEKSPLSSRLFLLAPVSLCKHTISTNQKGTACGLELDPTSTEYMAKPILYGVEKYCAKPRRILNKDCVVKEGHL